MTDKSDIFLSQLFSAGCVKFGELRLKSGIISPVYVDFRVLVSNPRLLALVAEHIARKMDGLAFDRIAALPYAGLPIGVAVSLETGRPLIYPRKEAKDYGTGRLIEGEFKPGERVVVVDDVITDGATKIESIKPLEEAGLIVKDVVIILDREQGGRKILADAGYTLHSVTTLSQALDALARLGKVSENVRRETLRFIETHQFVGSKPRASDRALGSAEDILILDLNVDHRAWALRLIQERWGATRIVTRGKVHHTNSLPGFVAIIEGKPVGLLTYQIVNGECEVITLDSLIEGVGVGSALMAAVKNAAASSGCRRVWLITTNDNLSALRFYQKRGLTLAAVHSNALEHSRKLKPEIPLVGLDGIPLRDEIELEMAL